MFVPSWVALLGVLLFIFIICRVKNETNEKLNRQKTIFDNEKSKLETKISRLESQICTQREHMPDAIDEYVDSYVKTRKKGGALW